MVFNKQVLGIPANGLAQSKTGDDLVSGFLSARAQTGVSRLGLLGQSRRILPFGWSVTCLLANKRTIASMIRCSTWAQHDTPPGSGRQMHLAFTTFMPGVAAGLATAGAWLTAISFFRSDDRIRLEDAAYHDGGATRIALQMESARLGRVGVVLTAAAIVLPLLWPPNGIPNRGVSFIVAIITTALCALVGWARSAYFHRIERPPEIAVAKKVLTANRQPR
jgi:hypothetical protein